VAEVLDEQLVERMLHVLRTRFAWREDLESATARATSLRAPPRTAAFLAPT
jgi:hypothetical protein